MIELANCFRSLMNNVSAASQQPPFQLPRLLAQAAVEGSSLVVLSPPLEIEPCQKALGALGLAVNEESRTSVVVVWRREEVQVRTL